ncbi:IclR family transcriptional regulator [Antrihabitans sp. YC2-6]|uniref:IclR family transcriptional regulator n=1 Tax=Antrihabitans sp. YC2-6 TaxID=2799498 RepID=UPI0018F63E7A|nr:IclR family transcriptional regulator [Antrihabitans sp. YC2-6]MBJ8345134.1 IclR family transcriptional regulator [Antrihabitans sp. YC2-6]
MAGNTSQPGASVISRALALLGAFDERHRVLSLTELAQRAEIPVPTAYRQVNELVAGGALIRRDNGDYAIGRMIWNLGLLAPVQTGLRQIASPFLHDIYAATLATVHLAVREGDEVLYIDRLSGHASVPVVSKVGSKLPMHSTGVGKVLLAYAPPDVAARAMSSLTRITPYTVTQPKRLADQLAKVRREGYATTVEEMTLGACSVAVPITRAGTDVVAALGIVIPKLGRDRPRLTAALQVAAQGISRSLGPLER